MEIAITKNKAELERLEGIIRKNLQSFYEIGMALREIRDKELYRDVLGYETFEAYVKEKWDFSSGDEGGLMMETAIVLLVGLLWGLIWLALYPGRRKKDE